MTRRPVDRRGLGGKGAAAGSPARARATSPTCGAVSRVPAQRLAGQWPVQPARHDPRDFMRLVEPSLTAAGDGAAASARAAPASAAVDTRSPRRRAACRSTRALASAPSYLSACTRCDTGNSYTHGATQLAYGRSSGRHCAQSAPAAVRRGFERNGQAAARARPRHDAACRPRSPRTGPAPGAGPDGRTGRSAAAATARRAIERRVNLAAAHWLTGPRSAARRCPASLHCVRPQRARRRLFPTARDSHHDRP